MGLKDFTGQWVQGGITYCFANSKCLVLDKLTRFTWSTLFGKILDIFFCFFKWNDVMKLFQSKEHLAYLTKTH